MVSKQHSKRWVPIAAAIVVALLIHLGLLVSEVLPLMARFWSDFFPKAQVPETTEVSLVTMSKDEFEKNMLPAVEQVELPEPPPPEPPPPPRPRGQVVELAPTPDSSPPKLARFLSEHNTNVKKEMIAALASHDPERLQPRPEAPSPLEEKSTKEKVPVEEPKEPEPVKEESPKKTAPDPLPEETDGLFDSEPTPDPDSEPTPDPDPEPTPDGSEDQDLTEEQAKAEPDKDLAMSGQPSQLPPGKTPGAPFADHVPNLPRGEATFLNSRQYAYATFFNRLKRTVSQYWHPQVRDHYGGAFGVPTGRGGGALQTTLLVSLRADGQLASVSLDSPSGERKFDDIAIRAFQEAAPFPNPPRGLIERDGQIHFHFGFILDERMLAETRAYRSTRRRY
jgi:TonB family protein